jgi:hypothetical protein
MDQTSRLTVLSSSSPIAEVTTPVKSASIMNEPIRMKKRKYKKAGNPYAVGIQPSGAALKMFNGYLSQP